MIYLPKSSKNLLATSAIVLTALCHGHATSTDSLTTIPARSKTDIFSKFLHPPMDKRPFVRWWWNGDAVTEKEILRELDIMKAAGIGGVEINPIGFPAQADPAGAVQLEWLSPEWTRMVRIAAEASRDRGMTVDLIVGSGWPFGGRFLKPDETIQAVAPNRIELTGPGRFSQPLSDIQKLPTHRNPPKEASEPRVHYARLYSMNATGPDDFIDVAPKVTSEGMLEFDIPAGPHVLNLGTWQRSHVGVTWGAPGADGPVMDHFNATAVQKYLNRLSDALTREFGGKPGKLIRAMFCDSIELSGANWTTDLPQEFKRRRGYDLEPWLPFIFHSQSLPEGAQFEDDISRRRYDFSLTLVELFRERFVIPFHEWCHANGTLGRYQAYGGPWLMGMLDGYMLTDIPEGDTWLFPHPRVGEPLDDIRYAVWNKYASSGAHLTGRPVASCESMTNTDGVFRTTLEYIKQADDLNFMTGINHTVLHGYNYSPPEAGFPGWIRYGTYFSDQNPWWRYFKHWASYNARLNTVLQESKPVTKIAILGPAADIWSEHLLHRTPFIERPHYLHKIWQALSSAGYTTDYVSESVVSRMQSNEGRLTFGPASYDLLLAADVQTLAPGTIANMGQLADSGARMLFVGKTPAKAAGVTTASAEADAAMVATFDQLKQRNSNRVMVTAAPTTDTQLLEWASKCMHKLNIVPDVELETPDERLMQIHQQTDTGEDIFLFVNTSRNKSIVTTATFPGVTGSPQRWDSELGTRAPYPVVESPDPSLQEPSGQTADNKQLRLHLRPLESLLLVFDEEKLSSDPFCVLPDAPEKVMALDTLWSLDLQALSGPSTSITLEKLTDFSAHPSLQEFAGQATYKTEFSVSNPELWRKLSLGDVEGVVDVKLNGKLLGASWYGKPLFDVAGLLKPGSNELEISLTTTLYNYVRTLDDPVSQHWTRARNWRGQGKKKQEPSLQSTGLLGPVQLWQVKD